MPTLRQSFFSLFWLLAIFSCSSATPGQRIIRDLEATVILISLDGFRYDYLDKYNPPTLNRLARSGVRAKWMTPSFPTKTFPNHYSIATGLYPENHGIVENNVYDFGEIFTMSKRAEVQNPRWWGGEPIWVTAEKQGVRAASYFFPGTETKIAGYSPSSWRIYNGRVPNDMRVDKALAFFDQPATARPRMISMYFSTLDDVGHEFGPDAEETRYGALEVDRYIERLMAGLRKRGIENRVNVIIVSDHGMAAVSQANTVVMDDYFDTTDKGLADPIITTGEIWQIFPKPGRESYIIDRLKPIRNATCWRKRDIPARLHYSSGARVAPIVCSSNEGWAMTTRKLWETLQKSDGFPNTRGAHGYDNRYPSMRATFIAHGPAFKRGSVAEPFENVDVYNLICRVLGLSPARNDGDLSRVSKMLL
ncbi:MAG: ectonucleotide pyrophosphatase/phosphodiesterase [Pyrinomonadaceae bacterium]